MVNKYFLSFLHIFTCIFQKQEDPDVPSFAPTPSGSSNSKGKSRPRIRRPKRPKVRAESEAESKGSANKKKGRILRTRKPAVFRSKRPKTDNQTDDNDEVTMLGKPISCFIAATFFCSLVGSTMITTLSNLVSNGFGPAKRSSSSLQFQPI